MLMKEFRLLPLTAIIDKIIEGSLTVMVLINSVVEYIDHLRKMLMKEFRLPSLTAIIDKIVEGSLTVMVLYKQCFRLH